MNSVRLFLMGAAILARSLSAAGSASTAGVTPALAAAKAAPNFVFILADDQSWSGTSVPMLPGNSRSRTPLFQTPHLERLATEGMTFSQAYAAHCKCECSRAAIQMGRTTTSLNAPDKSSRNWKAPLTDSLAHTLKRAHPAYRAAHFGKWQWSHSPTALGYDVSDGITMNEDGESIDPADPKLSFSITRRAHAFMQTQVHSNHPFYLQLSYYAVHQTPQALAATLKKYSAGNDLTKRGDRAIMAAMTEDLDTCVGEVLRKLTNLGVAENTYVIYMSDSGGRSELLKGGKGNLHEGGLRVPLIVRGPGVSAGVYSDVPVISYDLLPTLLDLALPGAVPPAGCEGGSWGHVLRQGGRGSVSRPIDRLVFHQAVEIPHPQSAIRQGDFKLIYSWDTRARELYNLARDLGETRNLADENPSIADRLQTELQLHVRSGLGDAACQALEAGTTDPRGQAQKGKNKQGKTRPR
jgi:arylsulfatase A